MADKVLVVEDEPSLLETLQYNLLRQGYAVLTARDGLSALDLARKEQPQLVVLDIMLPRLDGLEVCRILRGEANVPILMLTARADELDKVVGLEMGADDYMTKPFSMRELLARVRALLRRVRLTREDAVQERREEEGERLVLGDLTVLLERREVWRQVPGEEVPVAVPLKPKEYDLLLFMARHKGTVLSRDLILERVWGWDYDGGSRTVDVHIRWLRERIERDPAHPQRLVTVRGTGYLFEG
jgi:DNA-binding response OmpR family regulator